jgi:hypothetical protein
LATMANAAPRPARRRRRRKRAVCDGMGWEEVDCHENVKLRSAANGQIAARALAIPPLALPL